MLVQSELHCRVEIALLAGLEQVAHRVGDLGAFEGGLIGIGGEVDDGDLQLAGDLLGSRHAVDVALELNGHQYHVGAEGFGRLHSLDG